MEIQLADGTRYIIRPGPYGKGVAVAAVTPRGQRSHAGFEGGKTRGRKPRPSTSALRQVMRSDAEKGSVRTASDYIAWLRKQDPAVKPQTAAQTVYRERRALLQAYPGIKTAEGRGAGGKAKGGRGRAGKAANGNGQGPGRTPSKATVMLREQLKRDAGKLKEPTHYVRWLVDEAKIGIKKARPIVYRELRLAKS